MYEKKEEIWLRPSTKAHTPTEMSKGQNDNTNNATKKFDYRAIADRLRTVSMTCFSLFFFNYHSTKEIMKQQKKTTFLRDLWYVK